MPYLVRKIKDKEGHFRLAITWSEDSFTLNILKEMKAYYAAISNDFLKEQAQFLKHDFGQYISNLKQYIEEKNDKVSIKFKVAKRIFEVCYIIGSGSSVKYFSVELQESNYYDCVEDIMDTLNTNNAKSLSQIKTLQVENESFQNELKKHKAKIEEFVSAKKSSDKQMLSNFVILLNEKKSRIQYLMELLDAFRGGREPTNPAKSSQSKKNCKTVKSEEDHSEKMKKPKREIISESESDEDLVTPEPMDEDYNSEEDKSKIIADLAIPSTSKADFTFLEENSPPREVKIKSFKSQAVPDDKNYVMKKKTGTDSTVKQNSKPQTENVAVAAALDFNTQDMLDEL